MRDRLTAAAAAPIVSWAGLLVSSIGLFALGVVSLIGQEWAPFAAVVFGLLVSLFVLWHLSRRHRPADLPRTDVFRPFSPLGPEETWPRADVDKLVDAILNAGRTIPLVVGASGVGKSTLLNVMARAKIEAKDEGIVYEVLPARDSTLVDRLGERIPDCSESCSKVIVVDQFEQWLGLFEARGYEERITAQEGLKEILTTARDQPGCTIVLSLRREWYGKLGFLGDLIPAPAAACEIEAPALEEPKDPMLVGIRRSFVEVLGDEELTDKLLEELSPTGRLSPLQAQIVGAVLERKVESGIDIDECYFEKELGGVAGAKDVYFKEVLDGSPRPDLCMKILLALSVKTRFRTEVKLSTLVDSLYENTDMVKATLNYLVNQRLVVRPSSANYTLAHDFLAEFFTAKSGLELNPVERDNIQIYAAAQGEHNPVVNSRTRGQVHQRRPIGAIVFVIALVLMGARFLYFGIDTTVYGPDVAKPLVGNMFDATFLLILVPYAAWILYCGLFYDRLFVHLSESRLQRAFSIFIAFNLLVSVLIGILVPVAWLVGVATGGIFFAMKMLWLSRHPQLTRSAQRRLRRYALPTFLNLVIAGLLGITGIVLSVRLVDSGNEVEKWIAINLVVSFLVTYSSIALAFQHVTRSGISELLGVIGRPVSMTDGQLEY